MAKILVTPIASSGIAPFERIGNIVYRPDYDCYYINGESYPAEIVTIIEP